MLKKKDKISKNISHTHCGFPISNNNYKNATQLISYALCKLVTYHTIVQTSYAISVKNKNFLKEIEMIKYRLIINE